MRALAPRAATDIATIAIAIIFDDDNDLIALESASLCDASVPVLWIARHVHAHSHTQPLVHKPNVDFERPTRTRTNDVTSELQLQVIYCYARILRARRRQKLIHLFRRRPTRSLQDIPVSL